MGTPTGDTTDRIPARACRGGEVASSVTDFQQPMPGCSIGNVDVGTPTGETTDRIPTRACRGGEVASSETDFQQPMPGCSIGNVDVGTPSGETTDRLPTRACRGGEVETELLPVPLELARPFWSSLGRGIIPPEDKRVTEGALGILAALNFLYGVGWADSPIFPTTKITLGPGQMKLTNHWWHYPM